MDEVTVLVHREARVSINRLFKVYLKFHMFLQSMKWYSKHNKIYRKSLFS